MFIMILRKHPTISFYDGLETDTMILVKEGSSFRFAPYKEQGELKLLYALYCISKWKQREPEMIGQLN
ncbi:hypothetical protein GCM10008931_04750 [Oceanobacillus oncorhynchi subsp. oncorhynchi]